MKFLTLINHSAELLRLVLKSRQPADRLTSEYFRSRKYIGSKERKYISELVFSNMRQKLLSDYCAADIINIYNGPETENFTLAASLLATNIIGFEHSQPKPFDPLNSIPANLGIGSDNFYEAMKSALAQITGSECSENNCLIKSVSERFEYLTELIGYYKSKDVTEPSDFELISIYYSMPKWISEKLFAYYGSHYSFRILESLLNPAPLVLRINRQLADTKQVMEELDNMGIDFRPNPVVPDSVIIDKRVKIDDSPLYKSGIIEVQDTGSQIISFILDPQPGSKILDACAGAGGKTLHIAALTGDMAEIVASDVELTKLKELAKRARRASVNSISTQILGPRDEKKYSGYFDYALVDAPCSGMGTVRRTPMLKWQLTEKNLAKYQAKQIAILEGYSKFVGQGGTLVYSTCSVMPDENEAVINSFLESNKDFSLVENLGDEFRKYSINLKSDGGFITLFPFSSASDVFFVAKLKRD